MPDVLPMLITSGLPRDWPPIGGKRQLSLPTSQKPSSGDRASTARQAEILCGRCVQDDASTFMKHSAEGPTKLQPLWRYTRSAEQQFLGALRGLDYRLDERHTETALFQFQDAIHRAPGRSCDGVLQ